MTSIGNGMSNIVKSICSRMTTGKAHSQNIANEFKSKCVNNPKDLTSNSLVKTLDDIVKATKGHPNNRTKAFKTVKNGLNELGASKMNDIIYQAIEDNSETKEGNDYLKTLVRDRGVASDSNSEKSGAEADSKTSSDITESMSAQLKIDAKNEITETSAKSASVKRSPLNEMQAAEEQAMPLEWGGPHNAINPLSEKSSAQQKKSVTDDLKQQMEVVVQKV